MIFKLTLSSRTLVQHAILRRDDVTPELLKQMIENFKDDPINPYSYNTNSLVITDVLEAALKNPNLSADTLNLFKGFTKTVALTLIIPHPNISQELLDYYYKKGGDDVKKVVLGRKEDVVR